MPTTKPIEAARSGDPQAIADMINQALQGRDVNVKVSKKHGELLLILESMSVLDKHKYTEFIKNGISKLSPDNTSKITISGRATNSTTIQWKESFYIGSISPLPSVNKEPVKQQGTDERRMFPRNTILGCFESVSFFIESIIDGMIQAFKIDTSDKSIRNFGWILFTIGNLLLIGGCNQDTTVSTDRYGFDRTHNIGRISDRSTTTNTGGFIAVCGAIFITCSKRKDS